MKSPENLLNDDYNRITIVANRGKVEHSLNEDKFAQHKWGDPELFDLVKHCKSAEIPRIMKQNHGYVVLQEIAKQSGIETPGFVSYNPVQHHAEPT